MKEKFVLVFGEKRLKSFTGGFEYNIQESAIFEAKNVNVVVLSNGKGERLYLKKGKIDEDGNIELEPLTKAEFKEFGIQETVSSNSKYYVWETSEGEDEGEHQAKFDVSNPEDMRKAKKIAEKMLEASGENRGSLAQENEDLKARLELIARKELDAKLAAHSLGKISDFASESDAVAALKNAESGKAPVGGTPNSLSKNYYSYVDHEPSGWLKEGTPSELASQIVLAMSDNSDPAKQAEAQALYQQISKKAADTIRKTPLDVTFEGPAKALSGRPLKLPNEPLEDYTRRLRVWAEQRARWLLKGEEK